MRILVIDDETDLAKTLCQLLVENQYTADAAFDGERGLYMARAGIYDLLIVDVMMPKLSGYALIRSLREDGNTTPILLLTARDSVDDRVTGLDSGADDYLVKPFHMRELLARVRALTRRAGDIVGVKNLVVGEYTLDFTERSVTFKGHPIALTHKEFQMMELFLRNAGHVLTRELLFDRIWGYESEIDSNVLETYIHFLRKKLEMTRLKVMSLSSVPDIQTVRGTGYVFKVDNEKK